MFDPSDADFPNPERGFYGWIGGDLVSDFSVDQLQSVYNSGLRLGLGNANLVAFRTSDISASWLATFSANLATVRAQGLKVTLLFKYNDDASGVDAAATQIARHLEQLHDVLAAQEASIVYMRAGFIGAWGEWHSSTSGNSCGYHSGTTPCATADANRLSVRDALLAHVPASIQIGFRYPPDLMGWYPDPLQQHRVGAHNDCFMAGPSDSGTYANQAQRDYIATLTTINAFGGETCDAEMPMRTACSDILAEGPRYHLAWLNSNYHPTFLDQWRAEGCYAQVSSHIGYRLALQSVSHADAVNRGGTLSLAVDVRNLGWARMFGRSRPLVALLRHRTTNSVITGASSSVLQDLEAQATSNTRVRITVDVPASAGAGDHDVLLCAPDPDPTLAADARFSVRFANADNAGRHQAWDDVTGCIRVGSSVTVR